MTTAIQQYLRDIDKSYAAGDATEHTYRPAFAADRCKSAKKYRPRDPLACRGLR